MDKFEKFYRQVDAITGDTAPYAMGGRTRVENIKETSEYRFGFNDGQDELLERLWKLEETIEDEIPSEESVFYADEEHSFIRIHDKWHAFLSDTWYYASADWEEILPEEYEEVVKWYRRFGNAGVLYWVWKNKRHEEYPQIPSARKSVEMVRQAVEDV